MIPILGKYKLNSHLNWPRACVISGSWCDFPFYIVCGSCHVRALSGRDSMILLPVKKEWKANAIIFMVGFISLVICEEIGSVRKLAHA